MRIRKPQSAVDKQHRPTKHDKIWIPENIKKNTAGKFPSPKLASPRTSVVASLSAPASSSSRTHFVWPSMDAPISAVYPSCACVCHLRHSQPQSIGDFFAKITTKNKDTIKIEHKKKQSERNIFDSQHEFLLLQMPRWKPNNESHTNNVRTFFLASLLAPASTSNCKLPCQPRNAAHISAV